MPGSVQRELCQVLTHNPDLSGHAVRTGVRVRNPNGLRVGIKRVNGCVAELGGGYGQNSRPRAKIQEGAPESLVAPAARRRVVAPWLVNFAGGTLALQGFSSPHQFS